MTKKLELLTKRIEVLENKINSASVLMNFTEAANYLGINHFWLKFLLKHNLIKLTYIPGYSKPRIYKLHIDEFILDIHYDKDQYAAVFFSANKHNLLKYSNLKVKYAS